MSTLYSDKDKKLEELKSSEKRVLNIEYNPKVQLKKDLGFKTRQEEIDEDNFSELMYHKQISEKYNNRRTVVAHDIYYYSLCNNYIIRPLYDYKSELTEPALEAILEFCKEKNLTPMNERSNFFVLAPRKYFEKENMDISNVAFNIYYKNGYDDRYPNPGDMLIEIYGSDFEYSFWSPLRKIRDINIVRGDEVDTNSGFFTAILMMIATILFMVLSLTTGIGTIGISLFTAILIVLGIFMQNFCKKYKKENLNLNNVKKFVVNRRYNVKI